MISIDRKLFDSSPIDNQLVWNEPGMENHRREIKR